MEPVINAKPELYISAIRFPRESKPAATASHDFYANHQLVYMAFPSKAIATAARVLFRFDLEGDYGYLYVQSKVQPDWSRLPEAIRKYVSGPVPLVIPQAEQFRFRLLAKPSWRPARGNANRKQTRITLKKESNQIAWLKRKGAKNGFKIVSCRLLERVWSDTKTNERLPNGNPKPLYAVQFDGILQVTDREKLLDAVANGIGPQKAYGFGLLSLTPWKP